MASQKEIELILKARLDQGDSLSQAQSMAKSMSDALEGAFEGVGSRIVEKILREMNGSLKGLNLSPNTNEAGSSYQHQNYVSSSNIDSGNIFQNRNANSYGSKNYVQQSISSEDWGHVGAGMNRPRFNMPKRGNINDLGFNRTNDYMDDSHQMVSNLYKTLDNKSRASLSTVKGIGADAVDIGGLSEKQAYETDANIERLKAYQMAKDLGGNVPRSEFLSEEQLNSGRGKLGDIAAASAHTYKRLTDVIETLTAQLKDTTVALKATPEEDALLKDKNIEVTQESIRAVRNADLEKNEELRNKVADVGEKAKAAKNIFDKEVGEGEGNWFGRNRRGIGIAAAVGGAAMIGLREYSNLDMYDAKGDAGKASLRNQTLRETMSLDYGSMMATEMLGGQDYLSDRSRSNVKGRLGSDIGMGVIQIGAGIGTALAGVAAAPFTAGASGYLGALAGAGMASSGINTLSEAYQGYNNIDGMTAEENRKHKQLWKDQNQEFVQLANTGMGRGRAALGISQQMGNTSYANWIYGENNGLVGAAAKALVSPDDLIKHQAQFATGIDTMYGNKNIMDGDPSLGNMFGTGLKMEGRGLSNSFETMVSMYQGGSGTAQNEKEKKGNIASSMSAGIELVSDLGATNGLTQGQANTILGYANPMMSMMGGAGMGEDYARSVAYGVSSRGITSKAGLDIIAQTEKDLRESGGSPGTAHGAVARGIAVDENQKKYGYTMSEGQRMGVVDKGGLDREFIEKRMIKAGLENNKGFQAAKKEYESKNPGKTYTSAMYAAEAEQDNLKNTAKITQDMIGDTEVYMSTKGETASARDLEFENIRKGIDNNDLNVNELSKEKIKNEGSGGDGKKPEEITANQLKLTAAEIQESFRAVNELMPTFAANLALVAKGFRDAVDSAITENDTIKLEKNMARVADAIRKVAAEDGTSKQGNRLPAGLSPRDIHTLPRGAPPNPSKKGKIK